MGNKIDYKEYLNSNYEDVKKQKIDVMLELGNFILHKLKNTTSNDTCNVLPELIEQYRKFHEEF